MIVIAVVVELVRRDLSIFSIEVDTMTVQGEVIARLVVHSTVKAQNAVPLVLTQQDALRTLERMIAS